MVKLQHSLLVFPSRIGAMYYTGCLFVCQISWLLWYNGGISLDGAEQGLSLRISGATIQAAAS